jgi:hypothetical protein
VCVVSYRQYAGKLVFLRSKVHVHAVCV